MPAPLETTIIVKNDVSKGVDGVTSPVLQPSSKTKATEKSAIEAISQGGVILAGIPSFTEIDKQRRWMLEHMAGAFRVFARKGFTEGMSGHISLRDPEYSGCFWTNP